MRVNGRTAAGAAALVIAITVAVAAWAEPLTIRVGWVVTPGHMAPLIEALGKREPAVFKHLGQSYVLQPMRFNGTTPQIQAQAIGDLEVAAFSTARSHWRSPTRARCARRGRCRRRRASRDISARISSCSPTARSEPWRTSRAIASPPTRSARRSDTAMRTMFRKHGIKDSDFTTVEANFANMPAMLDGGKVDLIGTLPQFAQELIGNQQIPGAVHRPRCGRADPGGDLGDPRRRRSPRTGRPWSIFSRTISARSAGSSTRKTATRRSPSLADVTKLPKDKLAFAFTKDDFYHSPDARPDLDSVQNEIDARVEARRLAEARRDRPRNMSICR